MGGAGKVLVAMGMAWVGRTPHPADNVSTDHSAATSQPTHGYFSACNEASRVQHFIYLDLS